MTKRLGNLLILSAQGFLIFTHKMSTTNLDVSIRLYSLYFINSDWQALKIRSTKWRKHNTMFLPGESHGQRSLVGYSPWGHKESDTTERLTHTHVVIKKNEITICIDIIWDTTLSEKIKDSYHLCLETGIFFLIHRTSQQNSQQWCWGSTLGGSSVMTGVESDLSLVHKF